MATKTKPKTVRFVSSKHPSFRMIRRTAGQQILPNGNVVATTPELTYEFVNAGLEVREGQDMLADKFDSETGEVVEQDAIEWIRSQPDFNSVVFEVEPTAPPTGEVLSLVAQAAAAGDVEELTRLGDEEHESWNRQEVLDVILAAIERIQANTKE